MRNLSREPMPRRQPGETRRFHSDMACCKPGRVEVGFACERRYVLCCAGHHVERISAFGGERAWKALQAFASHLLGECAWPLADVFFAFQAGRQISALAQVCAARWGSIPTKEGRAAYAAELATSTAVYCVETHPYLARSFLSTFNVLCEAAAVRP